jgi:C4-dicarboxylate-specific signal transduction histidine kinase
MNRAAVILSTVVTQLFAKPDETSIVTNGVMFRHAAASPLSGLLLNLELAQQHDRPADPYVKSALHNAYQLKELFALTYQNINKNNSFFIKSAITEVIVLLRSRYPSHQVRHYLTLGKSAQLRGNKFLFQESLLCAINNALESYQANSTIKLVLITARETNSSVIISIVDGGKGFTLWQRAMAFADGFTTKSTGEGVGLSWIRRVVEHHFGGSIQLHSKPKRGTSLIWTLPK